MLTASRRWKRREGEPQAGAPGLAVWLDQARARWQGVLRSGAILQRTCHHKLDLALDGVRDALASPPSRRRPGRLAFASASKSAVGGPPGEPLSSDPILISELEVTGADEELRKLAREALTMRPNFAYTLEEVQADLRRIFGTGYFAACEPSAEDTRDGVKLTIKVTPNPELNGVVVVGADRLPQSVIQSALTRLHGRTLNFEALTEATEQLNAWYEASGILGQVTKVELGESNTVQIAVSEAQVAGLHLRFLDKKTGEARDEGRTRPEVILRHMLTQPGQVYSLAQARRDVEAVYATGLFDDVSIRPQPAEGSTMDAPRVDLFLEVRERKFGGLSAGTGVSAAGTGEGALPGFIGQLSYSQRNLMGLGQRLTASAELGQVDSTFRVSHTDPWIRGDPYHTSRSITVQSTKASVAAIHGKAVGEDVAGPGPGSPRPPQPRPGAQGASSLADASAGSIFVSRVGGSVEWSRPLGIGWQGGLGASWQRATPRDERARPLDQDCYGGQLTISGTGQDTMALGILRLAYAPPSGGGEILACMEQALPLQTDWLNFNRFTLRADKSLPLGPMKLWFSGKGGLVVGDLPPYEAFPIGGTNSVRGYVEGGVGSGRRYAVGTAELHVPLVAPIEGVLFADYGTDLDSGALVLGDPAGARGKPGNGHGLGVGVKLDTPIGPLRLEYAWNDAGVPRFHLGIGARG
ncbi:hypothetical protein APUTEX25_000222 [Auxenochlorella protothecoides]|uniref:Outer envelope protein 80, chloroplastic n=2 Tax=Auxenochlorella protothecoides TaxID=3075 RepID=A0A3M7L0E1_AUXPR|nr:hypothetical protein APUTEX25_000222 [Auxenochlorella protothecoides]|eukprot:RMZ55639.1 hypothetical protein APUTEX25_000222 [Auxenochlorella protothecoides]